MTKSPPISLLIKVLVVWLNHHRFPFWLKSPPISLSLSLFLPLSFSLSLSLPPSLSPFPPSLVLTVNYWDVYMCFDELYFDLVNLSWHYWTRNEELASKYFRSGVKNWNVNWLWRYALPFWLGCICCWLCCVMSRTVRQFHIFYFMTYLGFEPVWKNFECVIRPEMTLTRC